MGREDETGSHYEVLGVAPTASVAEIRAAYVALARAHHPDRQHTAGTGAQADAASRMARINAAWTVLSDHNRRAAYDARRTASSTPHANVRRPDGTFVPLEDDDDHIDPRLLDDTPTGAPTLRRSLTFLPAVLAVAGVAVIFAGFLLRYGGFIGLGVAILAASALSFLLIPLVAMIASSRADHER